MPDYSRMTKEDLIEELNRITEGIPRDPRLTQSFQAYQAELEAQNTQLKYAQQRLEEAMNRYADLYDFAPVGYADLDQNGCIRQINLTGAAMLGAERANFIGRSFILFLDSPESKKTFLGHMLRCRNGEPRVVSELSIRRTGADSHIQVQSVPVNEAAGVFFRTALIDVTELKLAQAEKERFHAQLVQAQKMETIGKLAGGVAHDFNNMMSVIASYGNLAMMETKSGPVKGYLEQICSAAERAKGFTRQLLIFSRTQPVKIATLDMNRTVLDMLSILKRLIGENIVIRTELEPALLQVRADKASMEQLLMNLIVNARDAMPKGGEINVRTENISEAPEAAGMGLMGKHICLSVNDSGCGMDTKVIQRIFEPFFTTKGPGQGVGLGLAVVSSIVKEHGGWVDVRSAVDRGAEFRVYLPSAPAGFMAERERRAGREAATGRGERILLIEDEKLLRKSVALVLSKNGYTVYEAESAEEAIEIFEKEGGRFNLLLSDIVLKEKSGIQLVEELTRREYNFKVLFTSGYLDIEAQWPVLQRKGYKLLQKPYDIPDLLKTVRECMGSKQLGFDCL